MAFIVLGLGTARFLQRPNSMSVMMVVIMMMMTATTNASLSIATRRTTVETQLPLSVGYQDFCPSGKVQSMILNIRMTTMQQCCKPWPVRRCHLRLYLPTVLLPSVLQKNSQP
jgi:hypothetical protein